MRARNLSCLSAAALSLAVQLAVAAPAAAQPAAAPAAATAPAPVRNAQEMAPAALLGAWKADIAASRYTGTAPRNNIRTFSYTDQGKVLVSSMTLNAAGRQSMLHWAVQLDGTPTLEFMSSTGSIPASLVSLKKESETLLRMVVSKHGEVTLTGTMELSANGETLTYAYGAPGGAQTVIVYRKWDMAG